MGWLTILLEIGKAVGPIAFDLVKAAMSNKDPVEVLAAERVEQILPTLRSEDVLRLRLAELTDLQKADLAMKARAVAVGIHKDYGARAPVMLETMRAVAEAVNA